MDCLIEVNIGREAQKGGVPPEDASMLNRIAEPIAGSIMANTSSSIGWSVRVPCIGTSASSTCRLTDITMVA